jgi:hypothetical protein
MKLRNAHLDGLKQTRGINPAYYDPDGGKYQDRYGSLPTFPYHMAPGGLSTRRQLRAKGLCPGGKRPVAKILWKHKTAGREKNGERIAYLYDEEQARPKRTATPAVEKALAKAELARHTCKSCEEFREYEIPRRLGQCLDCEAKDEAKREEFRQERQREVTPGPAQPAPKVYAPRQRQPERELEAV